MRPDSSNMRRAGIQDTFTPPCRMHSSNKSKQNKLKLNSSHGFYTNKRPSKKNISIISLILMIKLYILTLIIVLYYVWLSKYYYFHILNLYIDLVFTF